MGALRNAVRRMFGWGGGGLDAGSSSQRLKGFAAVRQHVNSLVQSSGSTVLARARYLDRNNGYAANARQCFVSSSVGTGIKPAWRAVDEASRALLQRRFKIWTDAADIDGLTDYYGLQARVAGELFVAGECFVRRVDVPGEDGFPDLRLQIIPSEMLDPSYTVELMDGHRVRQGIEFDRYGRRVAYHFWRENPGDATQPVSGERVRVAASEILHIIDPIEAGQIRGLPRLQAAIVPLWSLDVYDEAELDRKKTAAMYAGFVTTQPSPDGAPMAGVKPTAGNPSIGTVSLEPGTLQFLEPGEQIEFSSPADSGASFEPFQYRTLVRICAAAGLPYAGVTGDVLRANYSNMRAALIDSRRRMELFQHGILIFQLCRPVTQWWFQNEVLAGRIQASGYLDDPRWQDVNHIPPRVEWIDPYKDRNAELLAVRAGFMSLRQVIESAGYDFEEVVTEIAACNNVLDQHSVVLDSDPRKMNRSGSAQPDPEMFPEPQSEADDENVREAA